ncbi:MAG TPA: hypothetical protein VE979_18650, partial [Streptosporangiaceae bacterium]|nr:hypothetical protein [Streptosporangiaceae bacterium]
MPAAARRPAAADYPRPASHPVTPSARPGMTHRNEQSMRRRIKSTHIAESERMASISITPMSARRLSLLYPEMRVAAAPVGRTFACVCSLLVMLRA